MFPEDLKLVEGLYLVSLSRRVILLTKSINLNSLPDSVSLSLHFSTLLQVAGVTKDWRDRMAHLSVLVSSSDLELSGFISLISWR